MTKSLQGDPEPQAGATRDEKISAWKALTVADKKALAAFAERLAQAYQFADQGMTWEDLIQETASKAFRDNRNWELGRISFKQFLFGVLRSLAGDLTRTNAGRVRAESVHDEDGIAEVLDDRDPESILIEREREVDMQAHLAALQVEFEADDVPYYVLECVREGLKPQEIRERLKVSEKDFDAARKKIARRSLKLRRSN
jgi:DNA-directed RNA polymerase specialized sigma24 family protein